MLEYFPNLNTTAFALGEYPGTLASVTVSIDGRTKKLTTNYTIDVANKTVTFTTAPSNGVVISIKTFAISGENYRVLDQYTGDGSTVTFTTSTRGEFNLDSTSSDIAFSPTAITPTIKFFDV